MGAVYFHPVSGSPLPTNDIPAKLGLAPNSFKYIVATQALEYVRESLAPAQRDADNKPALVFHNALRLWVQTNPIARSLERIALKRAADRVAVSPEKALQIKTDVLAWREALVSLAEQGVDLRQPWPPTLKAALVNDEVGKILAELQNEYRNVVQTDYNGQPFEEVVRDFLQQPLPWTPGTIVMEGFTFFTPLQQAFIDACLRHGDDIHFIYPFSVAQNYGFAIMDRTYGPYRPGNGTTALAQPLPSAGDLRELQERVFSDLAGVTAQDGTVTIEWYSHRHHEVAECLRRIMAYVAGGVTPDQIAIVMRNPHEFESLILEEAERQKLTVPLTIPPRMLLLTPVGRLVLTLFQAWENGLKLSADQFEVIVASGWLGASLQASTDQFNAVKEQIFARCHTHAEWQGCLTLLRAQLAQPAAQVAPRGPAVATDAQIVDEWADAINQVQALCQRLFAKSSRSIEQHVKDLLNELSKLNPFLMKQAEKRIREGIEEALSDVRGVTVKVTTDEFRDSLVGMAVAEQQRENDRIWVTTPEGIDGVQCDVVFYLGADNRRVPRRYSEPWPFYQPDINQHQERERYYFLGVLRAAVHHLHLSYSRADEREIYRPSPLVDEALRAMGWAKISEGAPGPSGVAPVPVAPVQLGAKHRKRYTLEEIAHYRLCPFRYKLERLDPSSRVYRSQFQLGFVAQGEWLRLIMEHLKLRATPIPAADVRTEFLNAVPATETQVKALFPGIRPLSWVTIEGYVRRSMQYQAEQVVKFGLQASVTDGELLFWPLPNQRATIVEVRAPFIIRSRYHNVMADSVSRREWLIPGAAKADAVVDGVPVFADQGSAMRWWFNAVTTAWGALKFNSRPDKFGDLNDQLVETVDLISQGKFPKHPGDHCKYCSVRSDCLGLQP